MQQTREAVGRAADQAVEQAKSQLANQKERAGEGLASVAEALHETSQSLRDRNQESIGRYAETGAELVEQLSGYFRDRKIDEIVDDVEGFARRQAGLFLGGAFALGFILSRFFKSSRPGGHGRGSTDQTDTPGYARATSTLQAPMTAKVGAPSPATSNPGT
jgi:hypothetical protein